jgi:lipopolysaccharide transport system ATP-binding protein
VAAHLEPEILIVDEVLAVGDAAFQKKCLGKMEDVGKEGRTIVFVSHSMDTVLRLCNTAVLLENGSVKSTGYTDQVIHSYLRADFGTTAQRSWNDLSRAPGNDVVRLLEVKVHDEDEVVRDDMDITKSVGITMVYEVLKEGVKFTHSINLFNENGIHILSSHDNTSEIRKSHRKKGRYSSTMWVPENFFAEGVILVGAAIIEQEPFVIHCNEMDVVAFNISDPMNGESARGACIVNFPGVVRPILAWQTNELMQHALN